MASQKQLEANRRNAQRSTGPRTPEGKARCARNAVTHGLTATPEVDEPGGSPEYRAKLARWMAEQRPVGEAQRALVETACRAAWRLERCARHDDAATAERVRHAADRHDAAARAEAEALGRPLVEGPYTVADAYRKLHFDRDAPGDDPATRLDRLQGTAQGVDWLLERWAELATVLERDGGWPEREKLAAVRLLGRRPEAFLTDPVAHEVFRCAWASRPSRGNLSFWMEVRWLSPTGSGRGLPEEEVNRMEARMPGREPASAYLKGLVARERARLLELKETALDARAAADRAGAAEIALLEAGPGGALLVRYETAAARALHRALADLVKLRKEEGRESDEAEPSGADGATRRADEGDRPEPARTGRDEGRPEPARREDAADPSERMGDESEGDRSGATTRPEGVRTERTVPSEGERGDEDASPGAVPASEDKPEGQEGGEASSSPAGAVIQRNRPDPRSVMRRIREEQASGRQARRAEKRGRRERKPAKVAL